MKRFNSLKELNELVPWGPMGVGTQEVGKKVLVSREEMDWYKKYIGIKDDSRRPVFFRGAQLIVDERPEK